MASPADPSDPLRQDDDAWIDADSGAHVLQLITDGARSVRFAIGRFHNFVDIATALAGNTTLQRLNLGATRLYAKDMGALADALTHNTTLQWLDLSYNSIGDEGATVLASALAHNTGLVHLAVPANDITDEGVRALAKALEHNTTLTKLSLGFISLEGAQALDKALDYNNTLTEIDALGDDVVRELLSRWTVDERRRRRGKSARWIA